MSSLSRSALLAALLTLICLVAINLSLADQPKNKNAKRRRDANAKAAAKEKQEEATLRAARAQKSAAEKVLAAAESKGADAQSKLDSSLAKLKEESDQFHDAQSTARHLAKELAEIEQEIIDEQTADSPYAKASKEVETARAKLVAIEERILAEADVQSQLAGLSGVKLVEKQTALLSLRPDYIPAKTALETAGANLTRLRNELFQNDSDWKEASEALAKARKEEQEAEAQTRGPTSGRISIAKSAKNAAEAAAQARAAIAQADKVIRNIENRQKNDPPPKKNKNKK
jgi:electron transport complex protein RnfC